MLFRPEEIHARLFRFCSRNPAQGPGNEFIDPDIHKPDLLQIPLHLFLRMGPAFTPDKDLCYAPEGRPRVFELTLTGL